MSTDAAAPPSSLAQTADGSRYTLLTQGVRLVCKAISVVVVARLVTPADHGVFAMAASVTLLLFLFLDLGLGTAVVQTKTLSETQSTALLQAHLVLGCALTLVSAALAPLAARFYATPEITFVLIAASVGLLVNASGGFPRALLTRQLEFRALNRLETAATVAGTAAMIAAAALGAGPYTFVVFLLVSESTTALLAWRACGWRPRERADFGTARDVIKAGWQLTRYHLLNYFVQQLDAIAVGRLFGSHLLGLYNRAAQMLALPLLHIAGPLSRIAIAVLSRLGPATAQFAEQSRAYANVIAYLTLPPAAIAVAMPEELVRLVLGEQWPGAAPVLRWIAVSAAIHHVTYVAHAICVASGQGRRLVWLAALSLPFVAVAIFAGARGGIVDLAAALAVAHAALTLPRLVWSLRGTSCRPRDFMAALVRPLLLAVSLMLGAGVGRALVGSNDWTTRLGAGLFGALATATLVAAATPQLRTELRRLFEHLPGLRVAFPRGGKVPRKRQTRKPANG